MLRISLFINISDREIESAMELARGGRLCLVGETAKVLTRRVRVRSIQTPSQGGDQRIPTKDLDTKPTH